jgi:hypothetical protein
MDQEIYPGNNSNDETDRMPSGEADSQSPPPAPAPEEQDRMPGHAAPSAIGRIKSHKWFLFAGMGCLGGAAGALLAELAPGAGKEAGFLEFAMKTGIWFALSASLMAVSLFWANEIYQRHGLRPRIVQRGLIVGAAGGIIAGFLAEALFQKLSARIDGNSIYMVYSLCWAALGLLLGLGFAGTIPNFGLFRGMLAGALGGALGGCGFVYFSGVGPEMLGRLVGVASLGASLGLAIVMVSSVFSEATLEVIWAPNETTKFNLGGDPIYIGGGPEDQVFVRGLGERHASVVFSEGTIEYVDAESQNRTALKQGSRLQIGSVTLLIHAAK